MTQSKIVYGIIVTILLASCICLFISGMAIESIYREENENMNTQLQKYKKFGEISMDVITGIDTYYRELQEEIKTYDSLVQSYCKYDIRTPFLPEYNKVTNDIVTTIGKYKNLVNEIPNNL